MGTHVQQDVKKHKLTEENRQMLLLVPGMKMKLETWDKRALESQNGLQQCSDCPETDPSTEILPEGHEQKENTKATFQTAMKEDTPEGHEQKGATKALSPTILREDAPECHEAWWSRIHYEPGEKRFRFTIAGRERLSIPINAAGSMANAERVSRLCYVKFKEGRPKTNLIKYRDELFCQSGGYKPNQSSPIRSKDDVSKKMV